MEYKRFIFGGAVASVSQPEANSCEMIYAESEIHAFIRLSPRFVVTEEGYDFVVQMNEVLGALRSLEARLSSDLQPVFIRWFLSDIANQISYIPNDFECAASVIGQPPLDGSRLALWVIFSPNPELRKIGDGVWQSHNGKIWVGDRCLTHYSPAGSSSEMTKDYLLGLDGTLRSKGGSLADNCLRTWFMVRDIDVNYRGVVEGRNEVFRRVGLTSDTHFIASTGINGVSANPLETVAFSAFADLTVTPERITYLKGSSHLNPTAEYGVAFERGTAVDYDGLRKVYISGTASINNRGEVMYPGDIKRQTLRMLENINVLLAEAQAGMKDVLHFIVYLRDTADYPVVSGIFEERFPETPYLIVLAPVCRPGWLVEAECMAICLPH